MTFDFDKITGNLSDFWARYGTVVALLSAFSP
jgi:hypothetical protein